MPTSDSATGKKIVLYGKSDSTGAARVFRL